MRKLSIGAIASVVVTVLLPLLTSGDGRPEPTVGRTLAVTAAHGMVVAPGFIDMLGQSDLSILVDPRLPSKLFQGITLSLIHI